MNTQILFVGVIKLKIKVNKDVCIGCGLCMNVCPKVFNLDDDGKSQVICDLVPDEIKDETRQCIDMCPVGAISGSD